MDARADVLVVGAGLLGLSAAYFLGKRGLGVLLLDPRPPLTCTSDKSTECYRVFWPGDEALALLVGRSLELLGAFPEVRKNRRGYLYAGREEALLALSEGAEATGPLRRHTRPETYPEGAASGMDLLVGEALKARFPYLRAEAALHVRPAGWLDAWGLGQALWRRVREAGGRLLPGRAVGLEVEGGRVVGVATEGGATLRAEAVVLAAGPGLPELLRALGEAVPLTREAHFKAWFPDPQGAFPKEAPLLILQEEVRLFGEEEAPLLEGEEALAPYLKALPPGAHARPEGEGFLALFNPFPERVERAGCEPTPPPFYPELALRALARLLPGLEGYLRALPKARVDGGLYVRTPENRPLIGPLARPGAYALGAFSGFGVMAALGAGELLAKHLLGEALPPHARAFHPGRYRDPDYRPPAGSHQL
ncbi:NAD(P)/FAD-dependent oxidoreductase [Thermus oshimai]|uniref:NAD(P)/FAD-dependent oxidoreductase n=1 Tax=Thermus oshimai TaxID=56957 RepID=UPI00037EA368|nr:FAD-binding oxidoreductase [Thermus oshimai]